MFGIAFHLVIFIVLRGVLVSSWSSSKSRGLKGTSFKRGRKRGGGERGERDMIVLKSKSAE